MGVKEAYETLCAAWTFYKRHFIDNKIVDFVDNLDNTNVLNPDDAQRKQGSVSKDDRSGPLKGKSLTN